MNEIKSFFNNVPLSFEQVSNDNKYSERKFDLELSTGHIVFFENFFKKYKQRDAQVLVIGCKDLHFVRSVADYFVNGLVSYVSRETGKGLALKKQEEFAESNIVKIGSYSKEDNLDLDKAVNRGEYKDLDIVVDMSSVVCQDKNFSTISKAQKKNSSYLMVTSSLIPSRLQKGSKVYEIEGSNDKIIVFRK